VSCMRRGLAISQGHWSEGKGDTSHELSEMWSAVRNDDVMDECVWWHQWCGPWSAARERQVGREREP
jgi:hypothetical protein